MNDWNLFEFRFRRSSWRPGLEPIITPSKIPYGEFSQCHFEQGITQRNASRELFLLRHSTSTQRFLALSACQIFGDETSIASAEAMIRALPAEAVVLACFEVASTDHRWPQAEVTRSESIRWVDRAGRPGSALVSWLERQSLPSANSMTAYGTGEAWLCDGPRASSARPGFSHGSGPGNAVLEEQVQIAVTPSRLSPEVDSLRNRPLTRQNERHPQKPI